MSTNIRNKLRGILLIFLSSISYEVDWDVQGRDNSYHFQRIGVGYTGGGWSGGNSFGKHNTRHDTFTGHTLFWFEEYVIFCEHLAIYY